MSLSKFKRHDDSLSQVCRQNCTDQKKTGKNISCTPCLARSCLAEILDGELPAYQFLAEFDLVVQN